MNSNMRTSKLAHLAQDLKGHSHEKIHMFFWFDSVENIK